MIFRLLIATCLWLFAAVALAQVPNSCETCYGTAKLSCTAACNKKAKSQGAKTSCIRKCTVQTCSQQCKYPIHSEKQDLPPIVKCDYCTKQSEPACKSECQGDPSSSCPKICISRKCRAYCSIPSRPESALDSSRAEKDQRCESCKQLATQRCNARCPKKLGSLSCRIACAERECERQCLID